MSVVIILLLLGLWAALLLPGLLRARRHTSPTSSVTRFHHSMDLLGRTGRDAAGRQVTGRMRTNPETYRQRKRVAARTRRRNVLIGLAGALVAGSLLVQVAPGLGVVMLVLGGGGLVAFLGLLGYVRYRQQLAARVIRLEEPAAEPVEAGDGLGVEAGEAFGSEPGHLHAVGEGG